MRNAKKIVIFGVCLGLGMIVIQKKFQIDEDVFMRGYWIMGAVIVVGAVLVNILYNLSYQKKMNQAALLLNDGKAEEYIAEIERLIQTAKGKTLKNVLKLNLSAGYITAKQYDRAIAVLEELFREKLPGGVANMVCHLNLCLAYFYDEQTERAMELYRADKKNFDPYRADRNYGGPIATADIFAAVAEGQYDRAEELLDAAERTWSDPRLQDTFQALRAALKA